MQNNIVYNSDIFKHEVVADWNKKDENQSEPSPGELPASLFLNSVSFDSVGLTDIEMAIIHLFKNQIFIHKSFIYRYFSIKLPFVTCNHRKKIYKGHEMTVRNNGPIIFNENVSQINLRAAVAMPSLIITLPHNIMSLHHTL